jgi:hypothetical protein
VGRIGTHSHAPDVLVSHCPANIGTSGPLHVPEAVHGTGNDSVHGPAHVAPVHGGVGVGGGVGRIGTHSHAPDALVSHCPASAGTSGPLHIPDAVHGTGTGSVHGPAHVAPVHGGVGVGGGVGRIGTHSHAPDALVSHCPANAGTSCPLHIPEAAHGSGTNTVHGPPHVPPVHCGVGVGPGVGSIGTQAHEPAAFNSHCPTATGQVIPDGHSFGIKHVPPQGTLLH